MGKNSRRRNHQSRPPRKPRKRSEKEFQDTLSNAQRLAILAAKTPEELDDVARALMKTPLPPDVELPDMKKIREEILRKIENG